MTNSSVNGNATRADSGGGIAALYSTVSLTGCTISDNSSAGSEGGPGFGGGITAADRSPMTLIDCTVSGNHTTDRGGGIATDSQLTLTGSTVSDNSAGYLGGGIYASRAPSITLTNSTVSGNSTTASDGKGGGIAAYYDSPVALVNDTVSGNSSAEGGGLFLSDRAAPGSAIANSIVLGNSGGDIAALATLPTPIASLYGAGIAPATVFAALDPHTGGGLLADNGGPTRTIALLNDPHNPALNHGDTAAAVDPDGHALAFDQRGAGFARLDGGTVASARTSCSSKAAPHHCSRPTPMWST